MKKSLFSRALLVLAVIAATVFSGVTPAMASGETASFSASPNTFSAGGRTPAMSFNVSSNGAAMNRIRISVYDSAGSSLVTAGSIRMSTGNNLSSCFMPMLSPVVGCTKDGDDAGFFELSSTTSPQVISLDPGLFVLPSTTGNYNFHIGFWNGGSEFASANVPFTTVQAAFNITFNLNNGTGSQQTIVTQGTTFTLPQSTIVPPSGKQFAGWSDMAVSNTTLNAGDSYTVQQDTQLTPVWVNTGNNNNNQQQVQSTPFTAGTATSDRGSAASFSTLSVGANSPAYTSTFSGFSAGAVVDQVNFLLGDPYNGVFWSVPGAVTNTGSNYATWNPSSNTCGISAIRIGGVAQTASSGITCLKSTAATTPVQYWISFKLSNPTTAEISYDVAPGAFVVTQAGNYNFFTTLFDNSASPRKLSSITQAFDATPQSQATPADLVSFTLPVAVGQRIVGQPVTVSATDLALSTDYSVVLRSTPQILAQGRTVSSSFNTSVTIPDNLEPGWHSITFSATRSDGAALEEKVYFKINADGTLLASSTDIPAELAFTAAFTAGAIPLSLIVLVLGFIAFFVAREINPDFMRVMTLTRNENGELDFVKRRIRSVDF